MKFTSLKNHSVNLINVVLLSQYTDKAACAVFRQSDSQYQYHTIVVMIPQTK